MMKYLRSIENLRKIYQRFTSPSAKWSKEFNSDKRAGTYDEMINLYALRREERLRVLQALLPQTSNTDYRILELGAGTGIITELLLERFPHASVVAVDGAEKMLRKAQSKKLIAENAHRTECMLADFSSSSWVSHITGQFNLVVTVDALHHLTHDRKRELYQEIYDAIVQGGQFFISDHITSHEPFFKDPQYMLWVREVLDKLKGVEKESDTALMLENSFSLSYEDLQELSLSTLHKKLTAGLKQEGENPMPLMQHIDIMRNIGFDNVSVDYRYASFAIISAQKGLVK